MSAVAVVFPGQGAQFSGMMSEMYDVYALVQQRFNMASDIVGRDLWNIVQNNPDDLLNYTEYTQPILLTVGYTLYEILQNELSFTPDFMAGHSLGEYTALSAAGAMTFEEAVNVVNIRGKLMQEAVAPGEGAMAAILGLTREKIAHICNEVEGEVYPANYNSPEQVVIGGKADSVDKAIVLAKKAGAKRAVLLSVSVPSHTPLMRVTSAKLGLYLDKIRWQMPKSTIIYNVDAQSRKDEYGIISALGSQLYRPVQWVGCVEKLVQSGVQRIIEIGPGKVLAGLIKRINADIHVVPFERPDDLITVKNILEE